MSFSLRAGTRENSPCKNATVNDANQRSASGENGSPPGLPCRNLANKDQETANKEGHIHGTSEGIAPNSDTSRQVS